MPDHHQKIAARGQVDPAIVFEVLNHFHPLQPGAVGFIKTHMTYMRVPRKKILLKEADVCHNIYFILKGALRGYVKDGRREITTWISVENELVTSIASLTGMSPSVESIQAIEDCELLALPFERVEELYDRFPDFNITIRKVLQLYYWDAESRAYIARINKAEKKYRHFLERHTHLANRIQLKYIASYLGMTMETLSRVRRKMSK